MIRRQFGVLYRDFLFRVVDRELLSTHAKGDASQLLLQIVTLLAFVSIALSIPALIVDFTGPVQARVMAAWSLEHFLIATTMLAVGVLAVLSWGAMFPDHRDVLVLAPLPIRARTILVAKLVAVITALGVTIGALHLVAGLVWPMVFNSRVHAATMLALTSDAPTAPVRVTGLQPVLDRDLEWAMRHGRLAAGARGGLAIGVYQQGERRIVIYGAATPTSLFQIGSVTKPFTGLVLAEMVETHQVSLNQPVRQLIPDAHLARPAGPEITLLDLATHHAGLPSMPQDYRPIDPMNPYAAFHVENLYAFLAHHGLERHPDAPFAYSNVGFGLLGHALAARAGTDYAMLVRQVVTGPLGLTDTVTELSPGQQQRFLQGYDDEQRAVRPWDLDEALAGAGALRSTAPDMLMWLEANLHPERVSPPTLAAALVASHKVHATPNAGVDLALAWMFHPDSGDYEHGGDTSNFTAYTVFNPQADLALVVLSNVGPGTSTSADVVGEHILARLRGQSAVSLIDMAIPAAGGVRGWLRWSAAYWFTMIAAGLFVFGLAMGVQGIAAAVLPHRLFLRASSFLQLGAFVLIVGVYFLQPILVRPATVLVAQRGLGLSASPSYWFLGLFQALNGSAALGLLARNAWISLGITLAGTSVAYGLSYVRTLRRIAEQPDINPGVTRFRWLPRFGARIETAIVHFSLRTLLRSAPHRVILAFYWGLGLAFAAIAVKLPAAHRIEPDAFAGWQESSVPFLVSSVVMMGFAVLAARLAFAMPRDLRANWIFRTLPSRGGQSYGRGVRRALLAVSVTPVAAGGAIVFLSIWPWQPALGHVAALGLLGCVLVEIALAGAPGIPFTRSYLPGKSRVHIAAYIGLVMLLPLALAAARFERDALQDRWTYALMMLGLGICWIGAKWRNAWLSAAAFTPSAFEDEPADQILTLDVWDSRFATHSERVGTPGQSR